jgi:hypothetical protein
VYVCVFTTDKPWFALGWGVFSYLVVAARTKLG